MHARRIALTLAATLLLAAPAAKADWWLIYLGPHAGYSIEGGTFSVSDAVDRATGIKTSTPTPLGSGFTVGGTGGLKIFDIIGVQANLDYYMLDSLGDLTSLTFEVFLGPTIADFVEIGVHGGGGVQFLDGQNNPAVKCGALVGLRVHDWIEIGVDADADLWWLKNYAAANIALTAFIHLTI